ncbi:unnamed protein product [Symbiodinium natans]|uniref:Uncharacterized protein n=1 Tax=Symbiodinium natans TaxID=878477 RepID=A0A812NEL9_9DINO|nr:unnamed protein product [Symbiodinium natans]
MCAATADLETALTGLFSEVGSVLHIPDASRRDEPLLALIRRSSSSQGISLSATDFSGLFRAELGFEALQKLRQDSGMAEFAWRTFLQLLSSALSGQEGCATVASSTASGKRLELRFRLESAVLAAHLHLEAIASMPAASTEGRDFLQGLRGFVLDAIAAESSEASKTPTSAARLAGPMPSLTQDPLLTRAASEPAPATGPMTISRPPSAGPPKKRAAGSLVDPHRKTKRAGGKPFQLSAG